MANIKPYTDEIANAVYGEQLSGHQESDCCF